MAAIDQNLDLFKVIFTEIQYHEDLRNIYIKNIYVPIKNIISKHIEQGMTRGIFRNGLDVEVTSRYIIGVFLISVMERRIYHFDDKVDQEYITKMIEIVLYGIRGGKTNE
jgi:hypothetical protein